MQRQTDFNPIRLLVLDVDGVLTDGGLILHPDGTESKRFNVQDGHRIKMWQRTGRQCALLSGRYAEVTELRAQQLGIPYVMQDCKDKLPAFEDLLRQAGVEAWETAYLGDDLPDLPVMRRAGFAASTANGVPEVRDAADYVTQLNGGGGAVGEVIEMMLKATGQWSELMARYQI
jgi:3-deoxy-D-manno-octulosonate 8-phosphate phosphatase (KDO 8-P phosphatase)